MISNDNFLFIDISRIVKSDDIRAELIKEFPREAFVPFDSSLKLLSPVTFKGFIKNEAGRISINGHIVFSAEITCDRCLAVLNKDFCLPFYDVIAKDDSGLEAGEFIPYSNNRVLLTEPIYQRIFVEMSGKQLCGDDCKGLCPECGCNLNEQACSCGSKEIDPRLLKLKDLL